MASIGIGVKGSITLMNEYNLITNKINLNSILSTCENINNPHQFPQFIFYSRFLINFNIDDNKFTSRRIIVKCGLQQFSQFFSITLFIFHILL